MILTEGDSAKAFAMAGLSIIGRDYYGVFPLKGKLLNIREASIKQRNENDEINYLKQIIGLKMNTDYSIDENFNTLRYGKVMCLTDQDVDGSHIKGLLINSSPLVAYISSKKRIYHISCYSYCYA